MRYEPLANRVILEPVQESKQTKGGLFVPDIATRNKGVAFGKVLAVGPGRNTADGGIIPCHVKIGDIVLFPRNAPAVLPLLDNDGEETVVLMLPENDVIAVVHDLPRHTGLVDITGAVLSIVPESTALPDSVYQNRDDAARTISDLRQSKAPPEVIEEISQELGSDDHIVG